MADELEGFSGLTDAEKDAIWGAGGHATSTWGTALEKNTTTKYNGNPSVSIDDTADGPNDGAGYAYRDQIPVGDAASFRMWIAVQAPVSVSTYTFRWGLLRYDAAGALVDAVYAESETEDYEGSWDVLETTLAVGGNSFVRPFVSIYDGGVVNVGMMDVDPVPVSFAAVPNAVTTYASGTTTIDYDSEDFDYGAVFDTGTMTFTAPLDGLYSISVPLYLYKASAPDAGLVRVNLYKNGAVLRTLVFTDANGFIYTGVPTVYAHTANYSELLPLVAGDALLLKIIHDDTGNLLVGGGSTFSGFKLD